MAVGGDLGDNSFLRDDLFANDEFDYTFFCVGASASITYTLDFHLIIMAGSTGISKTNL